MKLSIVVPIYNSEKSIKELHQKLEEEVFSKYSGNLILVNDGSSDNSHILCKELAEKYPDRVKYILFHKNFGQINALMCGLREVNSEVCVLMDDDLQNPPSEVKKLVEAIDDGFDFAYGVSDEIRADNFRIFGSRITNKLLEFFLGKPKGLYPSSFMSLSAGMVERIIDYDGPYPYIAGLLFRISHNGTNVKVEHKERKYGKSQYNIRRLVSLWLRGMTNFSVVPLRITSFFGFITATLGFLIILYLLISRILLQEYLSGWFSTIAVILVFCGIQLVALGILGEYVGRIFMLMNKSPQYSVREKYNCGKSKENL